MALPPFVVHIPYYFLNKRGSAKMRVDKHLEILGV